MSWDKNTVNCSKIDAMALILQAANLTYSLKEIGRVRGYGLNDFMDYESPGEIYPLRELVFENKRFVEQMRRCHDCDTDDTIISIETQENIPLEIYLDCEDFGCSCVDGIPQRKEI